MKYQKTIILSDISGYLTVTDEKLSQHGVSIREGIVPKNTLLILNGDLVHRGPESEEVLECVDKIIHQPNVIVTIGNHDALYLGKAGFQWNENVPNASQTYTQWWNDGTMIPACGLRTRTGDYLVTHAGLSHQLWVHMGSPRTMDKTLSGLMNCVNDGSFFNMGEMIGHHSLCPGPIWCSARELLSSWNQNPEIQEVAPFHQVFGHSSPYDWTWKRWWVQSNELKNRTTLFPKLRQSVSIVAGVQFISTDPGHSTRPAPSWEPWVVEDARLILPR